jgi:hypothetical protein
MNLEVIKREYPIAYRFLHDVVKPTRTPEVLKSYRGLIDRWWQFWNHRAELMRRLRAHVHFIAYSKVTKYPICMLARSDWIYTNKVVLIGFDRPDMLAICLSSALRTWVEAYSAAGLGTTFQLSISESLDTFSLPEDSVSKAGIEVAARFNELAVEWSRVNGYGLTELMNAINNPESSDAMVVEMRCCLQNIDTEVFKTYGWEDLDARPGFLERANLSPNDCWRFCINDEVRAELVHRLLKNNRECCEAIMV